MPTSQDKATREREIFMAFCDARGDRQAWTRIDSRPEPEPDLLCTHVDQGDIAFELVAITDHRLAELASLGPRAKQSSVWTVDPTKQVIEKKLSRRYVTNAPIDLLAYHEGLTISTDDMIIPVLVDLAHTIQHPFRLLWYFGEDEVRCIWKKPI